MRTFGILGGIACGKSTVTAALKSLGAIGIDADAIGHEVLREPEVRQALVARWGPQILDGDGEIQRRHVGQIVFAHSPTAQRELEFLMATTHPRIAEIATDRLAAARDAQRLACVVDAALLLEAGWDRWCDHLIFVDVPLDERCRRACARGWSAAEFYEREARQLPVETKRLRANSIIDNSGPLEETLKQVHAIWTRECVGR